MKRGRILNAELSKAIAVMGHGDLFMVCDAGFPIPLVGIICGTDPDEWFAMPGTVMPEAYRERRARMGRS